MPHPFPLAETLIRPGYSLALTIDPAQAITPKYRTFMHALMSGEADRLSHVRAGWGGR